MTLVDHVYEANRMGKDEDEVEREALHLDEPDPGLRKPQLDKALGLLESPERLGCCSASKSDPSESKHINALEH